MYGFIYAFIILLYVGCLISNLKVIIAGAVIIGLAPILTPIIIKGEKTMLKLLGDYLGVRTISMKLDAVANYLKVKFIHIPEHYECKKQK